jgi:hypothetical protein
MTFAYHRSVAPMMWILVAIATVETLVVHLLVALWRPWVAALLSVLSVATIIWLVGAIRSFGTLPVEIADGHLVWRVGRLRSVTIPLDRVCALKTEWTAADIKHRDVLNCALIAYPNTVVVLDAPVSSGRRKISQLAHRLDDPTAFATALGSLLRDRA